MKAHRLVTISLAAAFVFIGGCASKSEKPSGSKPAHEHAKKSEQPEKAKSKGTEKPEEIMTRGGFR